VEEIKAIGADERRLAREIIKLARERQLVKEGECPIIDGVADLADYLSQTIKILWVLKEPHKGIIPQGNKRKSITLIKECFSQPGAHIVPTWRVIAYVSYGVSHNMRWKEMKMMGVVTDIMPSLYKTAYINISKVTSKTVSDNARIGRLYKEWKRIIFRQIELYSPNVVIFGNTFDHFREDIVNIGATYLGENTNAGLNLFIWRGRLLIEAYHPRQRKMTRETYVDALIETILQFQK